MLFTTLRSFILFRFRFGAIWNDLGEREIFLINLSRWSKSNWVVGADEPLKLWILYWITFDQEIAKQFKFIQESQVSPLHFIYSSVFRSCFWDRRLSSPTYKWKISTQWHFLGKSLALPPSSAHWNGSVDARKNLIVLTQNIMQAGCNQGEVKTCSSVAELLLKQFLHRTADTMKRNMILFQAFRARS